MVLLKCITLVSCNKLKRQKKTRRKNREKKP